MTKSKGIAYLLWLVSFFGWLGLHRFYIKKYGTGLIWIFTGGLLGFGALYDLFSLGTQVEAYNANVERSELREATTAAAESSLDDRN